MKEPPGLYVGAAKITLLLVLVPDSYKTEFVWPKSDTSGLFDVLSRHTVLYSIKPTWNIIECELDLFSGVVVQFFAALRPEERRLLQGYAAQGGKVYAFAQPGDVAGQKYDLSSPRLVYRLKDNIQAQREVLAKVASLTSRATTIDVLRPPHVLTNLTLLDQGRRIVIHLLNYDRNAAANVRFRLTLRQVLSLLAGKRLSVFSPDAQSRGDLIDVHWDSAGLEATLPALRTYAVIALQ